MSNPVVVYRTTHSETIAAYREASEARASWVDSVVAFAKSINGGSAYTRTGFGREHLAGIEVKGEPPEGWRIYRSKRGPDHLVPRRSTKAGKAAAKAFDALASAPSARDALRDMPSGFFGSSGEDHVGIAWHSPGADLDGETLTVVWGAELPEAEAAKVGQQWERVPLSRWHAEREAAEATA